MHHDQPDAATFSESQMEPITTGWDTKRIANWLDSKAVKALEPSAPKCTKCGKPRSRRQGLCRQCEPRR